MLMHFLVTTLTYWLQKLLKSNLCYICCVTHILEMLLTVYYWQMVTLTALRLLTRPPRTWTSLITTVSTIAETRRFLEVLFPVLNRESIIVPGATAGTVPFMACCYELETKICHQKILSTTSFTNIDLDITFNSYLFKPYWPKIFWKFKILFSIRNSICSFYP